jgi:hypothetical protein
VSGSLLTSLTAVDLATLERTLEFLATSAEPVDITADALPGDWAGGHYTVSDASRAAVQSFFNLSPAAAQSASGNQPIPYSVSLFFGLNLNKVNHGSKNKQNFSTRVLNKRAKRKCPPSWIITSNERLIISCRARIKNVSI